MNEQRKKELDFHREQRKRRYKLDSIVSVPYYSCIEGDTPHNYTITGDQAKCAICGKIESIQTQMELCKEELHEWIYEGYCRECYWCKVKRDD